jgi:hypothetical protein
MTRESARYAAMSAVASADGTLTMCMLSAGTESVWVPPWLVMTSAASAALRPETVRTMIDVVSVGSTAVVDVVGVVVLVVGVVVLVDVVGVDEDEEELVSGVDVEVDVVAAELSVDAARAAPAGAAAMTRPASIAAPSERRRCRDRRHVRLPGGATRAGVNTFVSWEPTIPLSP